MTGSEIAQLVELSEGRAYARLITGGPPDVRDKFGLGVDRTGSAYALIAARFGESLILNRVIGLGVCEPATDRILDALDALYAGSGVATYAIELSPAAEPADVPSRLRDRGFVPFKQMTMLYRGLERIAHPPCDLRVSRAHREYAAAFADLTTAVFCFDEPLPSLLRATFEDAAWQHWFAFDGDQPVAAAMTYLEHPVAWIGWAGTLPEYRGRGAHAAITSAQLDGAGGSDCKWVTLETATGTKKRPGQSLRNYVRLGWTAAYERVVYVRKSAQRA